MTDELCLIDFGSPELKCEGRINIHSKLALQFMHLAKADVNIKLALDSCDESLLDEVGEYIAQNKSEIDETKLKELRDHWERVSEAIQKKTPEISLLEKAIETIFEGKWVEIKEEDFHGKTPDQEKNKETIINIHCEQITSDRKWVYSYSINKPNVAQVQYVTEYAGVGEKDLAYWVALKKCIEEIKNQVTMSYPIRIMITHSDIPSQVCNKPRMRNEAIKALVEELNKTIESLPGKIQFMKQDKYMIRDLEHKISDVALKIEQAVRIKK